MKPLLRAFLLMPLVLACFALAPATDAQCPQICDSNENTGVGDSALFSDTTGIQNTANGSGALEFDTTGSFNTASGEDALGLNTIGSDNTANGYQALFSNTTSNNNTATGTDALQFSTTRTEKHVDLDALGFIPVTR